MSFPQALTEEEWVLEEHHQRQVVYALRKEYSLYCRGRLRKYMLDYQRLSEKHRELVSEYPQKLNLAAEAVDVNTRALELLMSRQDRHNATVEKTNYNVFMENTGSLLRQLVREWSAEGAGERACYTLLISTISKYISSVEGTRILVPGAGLGRLAWELARMGYSVEGNEFSHFMLLPSEFILNYLTLQFIIQPYCLHFSNCLEWRDSLREYKIPDVLPSRVSLKNFCMVAGDFLQVYSDSEQKYNVVCCCFFLDTANNILDYLDCIYSVLSQGGILLSYGPLLYHFEGSANEVSIELSFVELLGAIENIGFEVLEYSNGHKSQYVQNQKSMLQSEYNCALIVCRKPHSP